MWQPVEATWVQKIYGWRGAQRFEAFFQPRCTNHTIILCWEFPMQEDNRIIPLPQWGLDTFAHSRCSRGLGKEPQRSCGKEQVMYFRWWSVLKMHFVNHGSLFILKETAIQPRCQDLWMHRTVCPFGLPSFQILKLPYIAVFASTLISWLGEVGVHSQREKCPRIRRPTCKQCITAH